MTDSIFPDVIDQLTGIQQGDALDAIRDHRPQARLHAQESYLALFDPAVPVTDDDVKFTAVERFAVATFVTGLHGQADVTAFYAAGLARQGASAGLLKAVNVEVAASATSGPYGSYPEGPLTAENVPGPFHVVSALHRAVLGLRLSAALAHAHLLVLHPRDATPEALQALLDAGWSTTDIVTLSQLLAFLSFQIRVAVGLRALAALPSSAA
jgi:CMD domain protein